jgi:hypothetical protein
VSRTFQRALGRFFFGGLAALAAVLPAQRASALSPYLVVPAPATAEATAAYRYANMTDSEALAELDKRKIAYKKADPIEGVRAPVRLTGKLHGVSFHSSIPESQRATSVYEVLDARLALALDDFAKILERHDIEEVVHYSLYRPNVPQHDHDVKDEPAPGAAKAAPAFEAKPSATAGAKTSPLHPATAALKPAAASAPAAKAGPTHAAAAAVKPGVAAAPSAAQGAHKEAKLAASKLPAHGKALPQLPPKKAAEGARGAKQKQPLAAAKPPAKVETAPTATQSTSLGQKAAGTAKGPATTKPVPAKTSPVPAKTAAAASGSRAASGRAAHVAAGRPVSPRAAVTAQNAATTRARATTLAKPESKAPAASPAKEAPAAPAPRTTWAAPGTRHPAGLAIDVALLKKRDGHWISVASHFQGKIGAKTCGEGVRDADSPDARELRSMVCEANDLGVFTYVLTPNYNAAHADHFHMEIRPQVKWFLYN